MSISANAQITLIDTTEAYTILLTNEAQQFPTSSSRVPLSNVSYYTDIIVYQGTTERTDYTIGTISSANNITVSQTSSRITFSVSTASALSADSGTFTIPITIDGQIFNKIFSWSCAKQGETGIAAKSVNITASSQVFKSTDGGTTFSPDTITLNPVFQGGISYSKWQYSVDGGSSWTDVTSGSHGLTISSGVLTIAKTSDLYTDSITSVSFKCISSNSSYYDTITVLKLYDVTGLQDDLEDLQNQITTITNTMSGVKADVDAANKAIIDEVWKSTIIKTTDADGKEISTSIEDLLINHTTDLNGIHSEISDVKTSVEEKADGSTVTELSEKFSSFKQDADGFKQVIEENYVTKTDLNISSRNLLRNSKTLIFDSYNFGSAEFYYVDESGNVLTDENGNILITRK